MGHYFLDTQYIRYRIWRAKNGSLRVSFVNFLVFQLFRSYGHWTAGLVSILFLYKCTGLLYILYPAFNPYIFVVSILNRWKSTLACLSAYCPVLAWINPTITVQPVEYNFYIKRINRYIKREPINMSSRNLCYVFHILPQTYTANHATFPVQMNAITVKICGNFLDTKYTFKNLNIN